MGKVDFHTQPCSGHITGPPITLKQVYYVPQMAFTLISVVCLDKAGCFLTIEDGECILQSPWPYCTILSSVPHVNNLYRLSSSAIKAPEPPKHYANIANGPISLNELHRCMGHVNFQMLHKRVCEGAVEGIELDSSPASSFCEACVQGKAHCKSLTSPLTPSMARRLLLTFGALLRSNPSGATPTPTCSRIYTPTSHAFHF